MLGGNMQQDTREGRNGVATEVWKAFTYAIHTVLCLITCISGRISMEINKMLLAQSMTPQSGLFFLGISKSFQSPALDIFITSKK